MLLGIKKTLESNPESFCIIVILLVAASHRTVVAVYYLIDVTFSLADCLLDLPNIIPSGLDVALSVAPFFVFLNSLSFFQ